jgi:hypothetical protein
MAITSGPLKGIKAVLSDVFGTMVWIGKKRHPYRQLIEKLSMFGREPRSDDAALFDVDLAVVEIALLGIDLYAELATVELFQDTIPTLLGLAGCWF